MPPWLNAPESSAFTRRDGWWQDLLPLLAEIATEDGRGSGLRAHDSAGGIAATAADRWFNLDILITATDPAGLARSYGA